MKKLAGILIGMVFFLSFVAGARAGEPQSDLFSKQELAEIKAIAQKAYPRGARVDMEVVDDFFGISAKIFFYTGDNRQSLQLEVFPAQSAVVIRGAGSVEIGQAAGDKIVQGIENVLNKSPRLALENILD
jgi:hypothetical protein